MPHSDVENHVSESKSEKRCESWSTVPGMRSYHMLFLTVYPLLRFSFNVISITQRNQAKKNYLRISDCLTGSYIACILDDGGFIRNMIEGSSKSGLSSKIYGKISEQFQLATKR